MQKEGGAGSGPFVEERHPDRVEPEAGRPGRGLAGEGVEQGVQEGKGFRAPAPARKVQEKDRQEDEQGPGGIGMGLRGPRHAQPCPFGFGGKVLELGAGKLFHEAGHVEHGAAALARQPAR